MIGKPLVFASTEGQFRIDDPHSAVIGSGTFGVVYRGSRHETKQPVAIKQSKMSSERSIWREVKAYQRVGLHQNIVEVITHVATSDSVCLIMELADCELFDHVYKQTMLTEVEARRLFRQMLAAVEHMHCQYVVHCDIKLENWLMFGDIVKLTDFGLSHIFKDRHSVTFLCHRVGSQHYVSPDVLRGEYDAFAADAWSLSICLFAMCCGFFPFELAQDRDWRFLLFYNKVRCIVTSLLCAYNCDSTLSVEFCDLMHSSIGIRTNRLTLSGMKKHAWTAAEPLVSQQEVCVDDQGWKSGSASDVSVAPVLCRTKMIR